MSGGSTYKFLIACYIGLKNVFFQLFLRSKISKLFVIDETFQVDSYLAGNFSKVNLNSHPRLCERIEWSSRVGEIKLKSSRENAIVLLIAITSI